MALGVKPIRIPRTMNNPNERWCKVIDEKYEGTWYEACTKYSVEKHEPGHGRAMLMVGSPLAEYPLQMENGWVVTYCDVRKPPASVIYTQGDIINLPFEDASFDAASCHCVLTHAGLGRYGDAKAKDGDERGIKELYRVMKPGSRLVCTYGAVVAGEDWEEWGTTHRVYSTSRVRELAKMAGFTIEEERIFSTTQKRWLEEGEVMATDPNAHDYVTHSLWKN